MPVNGQNSWIHTCVSIQPFLSAVGRVQQIGGKVAYSFLYCTKVEGFHNFTALKVHRHTKKEYATFIKKEMYVSTIFVGRNIRTGEIIRFLD